METITNAAGSSATLFVGVLIGAALAWGFARWYYLRDGRAKLQDLEDKAKAQGVILRESLDK